MKKIIVCFAIGLSTMVIQGATATWGILGVSKPTEITDLASMTAYLVQETSTFTQSQLTAGLDKDGISALVGHTDASVALTVSASGVGNLLNKTVSNSSWTSSGTYSFYTVIIATDTSNNSYYLLSNKSISGVSVVTDTDALDTKLSFGSQVGNTSWKPTPAPEPTSGLLLLVGGALLALRRKQK